MVPSGPAACYGAFERRALLSAPSLVKCFVGLHGLPRPEVNRPAGGRTPDFRWPQANLIVEIDSVAWHGDRLRFRSDRARNRQHVLRGATVIAYAAVDLVDRPRTVAAEVRRLLARVG